MALLAPLALVLAQALGAGAAPRVGALPPGPEGWRLAGLSGARGITVGPIENGYHQARGYGSSAYDATLVECTAMGANWVALTPFGRVNDRRGLGVDPSFEAPFKANRAHVQEAIAMAHARGLKVMLVPHLWVESGDWRGEIDPGTDEGWRAWAESYRAYLRAWAEVAEESHVEMLSAGVELRSWVTTVHAASFSAILRDLRRVYHGLLTYSSNWDDVEAASVLGDLDVIGVNAFYPLADEDGAGEASLRSGGARVRARVRALADVWQKPVVFTETGYTTRPDPAIHPWLWPESFATVTVDEAAQAVAYRALLAPLLDEPSFAGFFVWRVYSDPDDVSQEAGWGFSPRGKLSELVVRDAFSARWAGDGGALLASGLLGRRLVRARVPGWYR